MLIFGDLFNKNSGNNFPKRRLETAFPVFERNPSRFNLLMFVCVSECCSSPGDVVMDRALDADGPPVPQAPVDRTHIRDSLHRTKQSEPLLLI